MNILSKIILTPLIFIGSLIGFYKTPQVTAPNLGASLPQGVAIFETALQSPISSTATSMTLAANSVRGGSTLSGYNCFTIDEGSAQAEYVCGTVSGTTVSSLTRGVDPVTATTTNSTLQFPHRRGANVKITDFPLVQVMRNQLNGTETIPNIISYTNDQDFTTASTSSLVTYGQLVRTTTSGAPTATEAVTGISRLATQLQMASSTFSAGTPTVLYTKYATSSPYTTGLYIPITRNDGKLSPLFIATTTSDNYIWGGLSTFNGLSLFTASTTQAATSSIAASSVLSRALILNNLAYAFPSSRGSANSVLTENGSGTLSWTSPVASKYTYASTTASTVGANVIFTSSALAVPASTLTASSTVVIEGTAICASGGINANNCTIDIVDNSGNVYATYTQTLNATSNTSKVKFRATILSNNSTSAQRSVMDGTEIKTSAGNAQDIFSYSNTSSIDWTVARTFGIKLTTVTGSGNTGTLNGFSIIVTP